MELRVVRYFLAVVDEGSITRAASAVRVAQPSLSRQLRQLEAELGVRLFDRDHGPLRLSAAGRQFVPLAREVAARAEAAIAAMHDPASRTPNLTVVAPRTTITDVIGPFLTTLGLDAQRVTIREAAPLTVFRVLRSGDADLGVSSGPPPGELRSRPIGRFRIWAQVSSGHRWADRRSISLHELVTEPLVVLTPDYGTRRTHDQAIAEAGLQYQMHGEAAIPEVVQAIAAAGDGVAIVTDDARYGLRSLEIEVDGVALEIPLVAAWDPAHYAAATIEDWADRLAAFTQG